MLIHSLSVSDLLTKWLSTTGNDLFESQHPHNAVPPAPGTVFVLVNGQFQPTAEVEAGAWTRLRLIFSAEKEMMELRMTTNTAD